MIYRISFIKEEWIQNFKLWQQINNVAEMSQTSTISASFTRETCLVDLHEVISRGCLNIYLDATIPSGVTFKLSIK